MNSLYGMSTDAHAFQYATFWCLLLTRDFCKFAALACMQPLRLASALTHKKQLQPMRFLPEEWGSQPSKHNYFKFNVQFPKEIPILWKTHTASYLKFCTCCTLCLRWDHECTRILLMFYLTTLSPVQCIQGYQVGRPCFLQWVDPTSWKEHPNLLPE